MRMRHALLLLLPCVVAAGCGGNPYGYARRYVPLDAEERFIEKASNPSYEHVRRHLTESRDELIGWFGTVDDVEVDVATGEARVALSLRTHQKRHLCADHREGSCRVTVSESTGGPFTAEVTLRPDDRVGRDKVWKGSLLKVYGTPTGELDDRGGPILQTEYYRHWPTGTYVTTAARRTMRR